MYSTRTRAELLRRERQVREEMDALGRSRILWLEEVLDRQRNLLDLIEIMRSDYLREDAS